MAYPSAFARWANKSRSPIWEQTSGHGPSVTEPERLPGAAASLGPGRHLDKCRRVCARVRLTEPGASRAAPRGCRPGCPGPRSPLVLRETPSYPRAAQNRSKWMSGFPASPAWSARQPTRRGGHGLGFREFRQGGGGAQEAGCASRSGGAARTPPHALPVRADGNGGQHGLVSGLEDLLGAFDAVLESEFKKWVISGNSDYCAPAGLCVSRDLPCDRAGKCLVADEHVVHAP